VTEKITAGQGRVFPGSNIPNRSISASNVVPMQRLVGLKGRLLSHRLEKKRLGLSQKKPENEKFDGFQKIQTPVSKSCLIQNSKRMRKKQEIENRLLFSEIQIPSRIPINSKILVFKCRMKNSTFDSISKHSSFQKHLIFVFLQTSRIRSKSRKNFESVLNP